MSDPLSPFTFVVKWRQTALKERAAVQEHFLDLCRLVNHPSPAEEDPVGDHFTFEAGVAKLGGGQGFADVWKKGYFAWEYKGKHANLDAAYHQLLQYREALENPPLLIVCDIDQLVVHPNFVNRVNTPVAILLEDLLKPEGLRALRAIFYEPDYFRAEQTPEQVTREAAAEFARLAAHLQEQGGEPEPVAHFLIRLLFCLFAEDIALLPTGLLTRLVDRGRRQPEGFNRQIRLLFAAMASGDFFGEHAVRHFNGGLFDDAVALDLDAAALIILHRVDRLDWASLEPSIFGTLFERGLDPNKRAQLGAHYTGKDDILLVVEPVLMAPLRREWESIKQQTSELAAKRDQASTASLRSRYHNDLERLLHGFAERLATIRVLDPACGSGNFLYVALRLLLDLWKEVYLFAGEMGLSLPAPLPGFAPSPQQLYGIEVNAFAHELAQATVWIGYLQWLHENGFGVPAEPVLKRLNNIQQMDAILAYDAEGRPVEPEWPEAEVIIGNPPFLGGGFIRGQLGSPYTDALFSLYGNRLPNFSDLVCYWFEKARALIAEGQAERAGLLATQAIRGGANRRVLERIKEMGDIFWAQSDRDWILGGATVHVSMVGFDNGAEHQRELDGQMVITINADLTASVDVTGAHRLPENAGICFMGPSPKAPFDIDADVAQQMLAAPLNVNGRPNADVVRPVVSGVDITRGSRGKWTIDFGLMDEGEAASYEQPFEYVRKHIYPVRMVNRRDDYRGQWWQYARPRPEMRAALTGKRRFVATPEVAKHRVFVWLPAEALSNQQTLVFARDDDYFFGVLHSTMHEVWARRLGTQLREAESGFRYTPTTTFETFPFPWPPGQEPQDEPRVRAIAQVAKELNDKREAWLNPPGASEAELKKRTLTNLYNQRPAWLDLAHKKLDAAVLAAYGWPAELTDEEILARLLSLNWERTETSPANKRVKPEM